MTITDWKTPAGFLMWAVAVLAAAAVARIGWELGARLLAVF
jgi:hypothetical protein